MKKILAPYFKTGIFKNNLILGFGSIKEEIHNIDEHLFYLKALKFLSNRSATKNEYKKYLNQIILHNNKLKIKLLRIFDGPYTIEDKVFNKNDRYSRNKLYYNIYNRKPQNVQNILSSKHVVIIGCGGIGNLISASLATAGIKKLTLVDDDVVELSNLHRQILFSEKDVGKKKTQILKKELQERNNIQIDLLNINFSLKNNINFTEKVDLIVLSADSHNIINEINEFSIRNKIPYINVGYIQDIACWGPLVIPGETGCYMCATNHLAADSADNKEMNQLLKAVNSNYQAPSVASINMLASSLALIDIIKFLGNIDKIHCLNKRIGLWSHNLIFESQDYTKNPNCHYCQ